MKRKALNWESWACILQRRQRLLEIREGWLCGIDILAVTQPQIWQLQGQEITVCDRGMSWITFLPRDQYFCITAMRDDRRKTVLWYVDMIGDQGLREDGMPWFDDLYLDLILFRDGTLVVDDADELAAALESGDITPQLHALALRTAKDLSCTLLSDADRLEEKTEEWYRMLFSRHTRPQEEST